MATRLYLVSTAEAAPITPANDSAWTLTSILARVRLRTTQISEAMNDVSFDDSDLDDQNVLYRQAISLPLTTGQTITGGQALKAQMRATERVPQCNQFVAFGLRVIAADGSTVQKTVLSVTRDGTEIGTGAAAGQNRAFTATSAATNYTTVAGDRLVLEIGTGGDPSTADHDATLRFGDAAASDLPEDDTTTDDLRPWFELTDTLTFESEASGTAQTGNFFVGGNVHLGHGTFQVGGGFSF